MEVYPEKWWANRIMRVAHDVMCTVHFSGYNSIQRKIITVISYHLILNVINMSFNEFDVNVANGVAIDVAYDILSVWWMEVYPFHFSQSKSLLQAKFNSL